MRKHKINGHTYKDFEKIGIPVDRIYPLAEKHRDKKVLLDHIFFLKFNKMSIGKLFSMEIYYANKVHDLRKNNVYEYGTKEAIGKVRNDLMKSAELFGFSEVTANKIWENVVTKYYLQ